MMFLPEKHTIFADRENSSGIDERNYNLWPTLAWFAVLLGLTAITGYIIALTVFLLSFLKYRAQLNLLITLIYSTVGIAFMLFLAKLLNRDFPPGLLQSYFDLPWPFT
jgi:tellurite resistance protein TehA-like permease